MTSLIDARTHFHRLPIGHEPRNGLDSEIFSIKVADRQTDRQTDTKTANKARLKLTAHEPIIMTMDEHLIHPAHFFIGVQI